MLDLYPDFKSKLITKEQYLALKERYENSIARAKKNIEDLQKQIAECGGGLENNRFLDTFLKYHSFEKLTREILLELVEIIYIHEGGGVEIHLKCQDAFALAMEYADKNHALISDAHPISTHAVEVI